MMSGWRDKILSEFTPQVSRLTLVADPDRLLTEEGVLQGIRERRFELIPFEDPVAFRFAYESNYRALWDRGEATDLVVVLRSQSRDLESLPYACGFRAKARIDSAPLRAPIPLQGEHPIRSKASTDSASRRAVIPTQGEQPIR